MINITKENKNTCCGCTACKNICPKDAIKMQEDFEGFLYPVIDKSRCINCGLCDKVCPVINKKKNSENNIEAYAMRLKDKDSLRNSTSGGAFSAIAKYVLRNDGIVFGVGYNENYEILHKEANNYEEIKEMRGSKYIQSDLNDSFKKTKEYLVEGKYVLFSGTPCQIEGLKNFLDKDYNKLITVDLICHGVPSPKLWREYLKYQKKKFKSDIEEISFRNKTYGYHSGTMKIKFNNGKTYFGSARVDLALKSFFKEISSRPSCYDCAFKKKSHVSEFTIFDCWSFEKLVSNGKDDDLGYTNILVNNKKGKKIYNEILADIYSYPVDINMAIKLDGIMVENSAIPHKDRNLFYTIMNERSLKEAVQEYIPITIKDYAIEKIKAILFNLGILKQLKKIKEK